MDKDFIISFESGSPEWDKCILGDLSEFPAIKWKLQNINRLRDQNIAKYNEGIEKLQNFFKPQK